MRMPPTTEDLTGKAGSRSVVKSIAFVLLLVFAASAAFCPNAADTQQQQPTKCDHVTDARSRFDNMRIFQPVKVENFDGKTFTWFTRLEKAQWPIDADTYLDPLFAKEFARHEWWIIYCIAERHIYAVTRVNPKQVINNAKNRPRR